MIGTKPDGDEVAYVWHASAFSGVPPFFGNDASKETIIDKFIVRSKLCNVVETLEHTKAPQFGKISSVVIPSEQMETMETFLANCCKAINNPKCALFFAIQNNNHFSQSIFNFHVNENGHVIEREAEYDFDEMEIELISTIVKRIEAIGCKYFEKVVVSIL